jgi:predicted helicase
MLDTGRLNRITTFPALIDYLRDELDWPIEDFTFEDLTYDWDPAEFGLSSDTAGQIEIKQLRPIEREPWGIFFLSLPHKKLPVTVLRRILGGLAIKKRASSNAAERAAWNKDDLLFIAAHGAGGERSLAFAHFHEDKEHGDLPSLQVLGWDEADTIRRLSDTHETLKNKLHWRERGEDDAHWRARWNEAFRERPGESIATSKALAKELARLAREIRRRANELLREESDKGPLRTLHTAFKEALIHDLEFDDFADMYAQTIAYGLLAARISRESGALVSENAADLAPPTNPFLKELLQTFLSAGGRRGGMDFDELGVNDVVEMLRRADMHAVLLDFDDKNPREDPVIHFYELFLEQYDKDKKIERGVFYTPRPVVGFIVRSLDESLRSDFGLEDGLASTATWGEVLAAKPDITLPAGTTMSDPFVRILDPATGTGTFLVEIVDLVHDRLTEKWKAEGKADSEREALWNDYVPRHLLPRLYGFELMMAPYAIAHMKLGLKLAETGYHFRSKERARIYLTNALEPAQDFDMQLAFMSKALAHEAQAANQAKGARFTVVAGNPPYSSSVSEPVAIMELLEDWKRDLNETKADLNREEWKFLRLASNKIELTGIGCVGFIINRDYLDGITKRLLRAWLAREMPLQTHVDLNGDVKGNIPDENVFEIMQGVAICLLSTNSGAVRYNSIVGSQERKYALLENANAVLEGSTTVSIRPPYYRISGATDVSSVEEEYYSYPDLPAVFTSYSSGIQTKCDPLSIQFSEDELWRAVQKFATLTPAEARAEFGLGEDGDWSVKAAQVDLNNPRPDKNLIAPIQYKPFDVRSTYWTGRKGFHARPRREIMAHIVRQKNVGLLFNRQVVGDFSHFFVSNVATNHGTFYLGNKGQDYLAPLWLIEPSTGLRSSNVSSTYSNAIATETGLTLVLSERGDLQTDFGPRDVFDWIYAIVNAPTYRSRFADYLKGDFPRIPFPGSKSLFCELVPLGTKLVALHLLDPAEARELKDPQSVRFAGHGDAHVEHAPEWAAAGGNRATISNHRWFEGVPERAWDFRVGGYQPAEKWLKDRAPKGGKKATPGRILSAEDQLHYRRMIVAMDKTIDIMAEIDRTIEKHGGWQAAFKGICEA